MTQTFTSFQEFKRRYPIRPNEAGNLLGSGSYGRVIKVEDQLETEWVAIKISEFKGNDSKSLKAEVELAQRVPRQANIARYDACYRLETDTSVSDFAVMKYYPDGNLADLLRHRALTGDQIYDITRGILLGLQHLHRHRIVHRDFKPANILISRDNAGRFIPKIADFGLSKLVADEELDSSDFDLSDGRGTPSYKAPEQIEGSRVSFNLDLWAFGVILYEMMTGEKPFRSDSRNSSEQSVRREIEKKIITVELPARLTQIDEPYRAIISRCLVRDIHQRARKEGELLDLLDRVAERLGTAAELVEKNEYEAALTLFEQVLAIRDQHPEAQKGVDICRAAIQQRQESSWLNDAERAFENQQFEEAKERYEQILRHNPSQMAAIRGLAVCIDQLRPKPLVMEQEATDVYQQELTDSYAAPASVSEAPVTTSVQAATDEGIPSYHEVVAKPVIAATGKPATVHRVPWQIIVPVVIGLGLIGYVGIRRTGSTGVSSTQSTKTLESATTVPVVKPNGEAEPKATAKTASPDAVNSGLTKRIDVALKKARQYYQRKDYGNAMILANSALQLDPSRRDVLALRAAALKASPVIASDSPKPTITNVPATELATAPVVEKPTEPVVDLKEALLKKKHEQQNNYEQLIEEGVQAISRGNNKAKAMASFTNARELAKEHDLSTSKAENAYATYLAKANRIFDNADDKDSFTDAKAWYQVAQALKDTEEVRRKIKLCINQ